MRFLVIAALVATACAMDYVGPTWPRLPLDLILRGERPVYSGDKIVGGVVVEPNSIPSQISLQRRGALGTFSQSCGGSILDKDTILNAAHCVSGITDLTIFRVAVCQHQLSVDSGLEQYLSVKSYKMHEEYNSNTFNNDISLIQLDKDIDLTVDCAEPIELPQDGSEEADGAMFLVSGWGTTQSGGSISDVLKAVEVPYVPDDICNTKNYPGQITESMICAGAVGIDSCQGDSGGPLFRANGSSIQVGIVSWGRGCALEGYPGVYTQVSKHIDWINRNNQ